MRRHVTDEEMMRSMDGELGGWGAARVKRHLAGCGECRGRRLALEEASARLGDALRGEHVGGDGLRWRVARRMMVARDADSGGRFPWGRVAVALPVIALVMAGVVLHQEKDGMVEPDARLTPGAVRGVGVAELCREGGEDFDPEVPVAVRKAVFAKYGMSDGRAGEYQVDYLVSPQLGGTAAVENLWPEPYGSPVWNAQAKDVLERRLRQMVCGGQVDLRAAQEAIRGDWIGAYQKYVVEGR